MGHDEKLIRSKAFALYKLRKNCEILCVGNPSSRHQTVGTEDAVTCCSNDDIVMQTQLPSVGQKI